MRELQGKLDGRSCRVAIVVSRFNRSVTSGLLDGALEALRDNGVEDARIDVLHVPGAFEITLAAAEAARTGRYSAVVCLGAVIRGETPHFEFIAREVSRGISEAACRHRVPVAFGVLTTETVEQALARAGEGHGNKGYEATTAALEMVGLLSELGRSS
jgi:6,7-dimethyl-8-ribityllumazine synthase